MPLCAQFFHIFLSLCFYSLSQTTKPVFNMNEDRKCENTCFKMSARVFINCVICACKHTNASIKTHTVVFSFFLKLHAQKILFQNFMQAVKCKAIQPPHACGYCLRYLWPHAWGTLNCSAHHAMHKCSSHNPIDQILNHRSTGVHAKQMEFIEKKESAYMYICTTLVESLNTHC